MAVTEVQVRIPADSGLPEDDVVNTFHLSHDGTVLVQSEVDDVVAALVDFYQAADPTTARSISSFMANQLARSIAQFKFYDAEKPKPNPPYNEVIASIFDSTPTTTDLPSEVAVCLSYTGDGPADQPAARKRGRIFLGPLNASASAAGTGGARPALVLRETIAAAAVRLTNNIRAIGGALVSIDWTVYSRGQGTLDLNNPDGTEDWTPFTTDVIRGYVDDAFDTQRRRGIGPTARLTWSV